MYGEHQEAYESTLSRVRLGRIISYPLLGLAIVIFVGSTLSYANQDFALAGVSLALALGILPYHEIDMGRNDLKLLSRWEDEELMKHSLRTKVEEEIDGEVPQAVLSATAPTAPPAVSTRNWLAMAIIAVVFLAVSVGFAPTTLEGTVMPII